MQAVRLYGVGDLRVEDAPEPSPPGVGEVIVHVDIAGICGSDVHNFLTGRWLTNRPTVPGHEFTGTVVATGEGAEALDGRRVVADSRVVCRTCTPCRRGAPQVCSTIGYVGEVCDGGLEPLVRLPADQVLPVPTARIDAEAAAMAEPLAVAMHAVNRLDPGRGEPVVVAGAGAIGALAALVLEQRGCGPLSIVDRNSARLAAVCSLCQAVPVPLDAVAGAGDEPPAYVLDTTGSTQVAALLIEQVAPGGRVASIGIGHGHTEVDLNRLVERELDWRGVASFRDELHDALALLPVLAPALKALAGEPISLAEVPAAYDSLASGTSSQVKIVVRP